MLPHYRISLLLSVMALACLAVSCSQNPAAPSGGATILVDASGQGDYTTIQAGLDAAAPGDTVLVAPGLYAGEGNRDLDFDGKPICLRSVAGAESTIIDCGEAARGFTFSSGEGSLSIVDGLTVTGGFRSQGGAIYCDAASPSLRNVLVVGNTATSEGGGAFLRGGSSPSFSNVRFERNDALGFDGGAVFCRSSSPVFFDVAFSANTASSGGAIHAIFSDLVISDAVFDSNAVSLSGGAVYLGGSTAALDGVVFYENEALEGGAVCCDASSPALVRVTMARNGAITGGGVFCGNGSSPTITNSIVAFSVAGAPLHCRDDIDLPVTTRSCVYANAEGDSLCGEHAENLFEDPEFCDLYGGDLHLSSSSPCLPANNDWTERIGALGEGCARARIAPSTKGGRP